MRWLLLSQCEDADPEADPSPHPLLVQHRTLLVPLLLLLLLLAVLFSTVRGVLEPHSV
jgi:hypothetical protein